MTFDAARERPVRAQVVLEMADGSRYGWELIDQVQLTYSTNPEYAEPGWVSPLAPPIAYHPEIIITALNCQQLWVPADDSAWQPTQPEIPAARKELNR